MMKKRWKLSQSSSLRLWVILVVVCLLAATTFPSYVAHGWEWSDFVVGGTTKNSSLHNNNNSYINTLFSFLDGTTSQQQQYSTTSTRTTPLSIKEVSGLRVRDIKRRLARVHGYSAEELTKMIDKVELIHALAYEEDKVRTEQERYAQSIVLKQAVLATIVAMVLVYCWPILTQAYEVAMVNWVVYTDRKKYEATRCYELNSYWGMIGIVLMGILDIVKVWLTASILLSWFIKSKYFFPTPSIPIRASDVLNFGNNNTNQSSTSLGGYGINIGPMIVRWIIGFVYGRMEQSTARVLVQAQKVQKHAERVQETEEDKQARKDAKRLRKLQKKQQEETIQQMRAAEVQAAMERNYTMMMMIQQQNSISNHNNSDQTNNDRISNATAEYDYHDKAAAAAAIETTMTTEMNHSTVPWMSNEQYPYLPTNNNNMNNNGGAVINNKSRFSTVDEEFSERHQQPHYSTTHQEFLEQLETYASELDDMD